MTPPRVLVVMPTRGYAYAPSLIQAVELARHLGHELVIEMGKPIELVRTRLVSRFLESGAGHLVTIDDDIVAPPAADRLLALGAPVATAPCPIVIDGRVVWNVKAVGSDDWMTDPPAAVFPVRHTGLGLTVVHRDRLREDPQAVVPVRRRGRRPRRRRGNVVLQRRRQGGPGDPLRRRGSLPPLQGRPRPHDVCSLIISRCCVLSPLLLS